MGYARLYLCRLWKRKQNKIQKKTKTRKQATLTLFIHINNTKYKNRTGSVNREERELIKLSSMHQGNPSFYPSIFFAFLVLTLIYFTLEMTGNETSRFRPVSTDTEI